MSFAEFKTACKIACHERQACSDGYRAMLAAEDIPSMVQVWRNNWDDIIGSKYAQIILDELMPFYIEERREFNRAGFYYNESANHGLCLVGDTENKIHISGGAECYVIGKCKLIAEGISKVYNQKADAHIILQGYSTGRINAGYVEIRERATAYVSVDATCVGAARVFVSGNATLTTYGHQHICAYDTAKVDSWTYNHIDLYGKASIIKR